MKRKRLMRIMVLWAVVSMFMCPLWEVNAQESCENVVYTVIAGPSTDDILSVYKIDDNNFYILSAGLPSSPTGHAPSGLSVVLYHLYYYTNGTWNPVLDTSRDPFETSSLTNMGGGVDLSDVARAATEGRVATLLLEADRHIPGRIDADTGALVEARLDDPRIDDMLDDLGERVLRSGGEVVIVPADRMPTPSGLAATYRF